VRWDTPLSLARAAAPVACACAPLQAPHVYSPQGSVEEGKPVLELDDVQKGRGARLKALAKLGLRGGTWFLLGSTVSPVRMLFDPRQPSKPRMPPPKRKPTSGSGINIRHTPSAVASSTLPPPKYTMCRASAAERLSRRAPTPGVGVGVEATVQRE
jgi:hypothetical protein